MKLINDLPDDCLYHIFHRLPLSEQIYLHRVCARWRSLQSSVTATTKSLTLHIAITEQKFKSFFEVYSPLTIPYLDRIDPSSKSQFKFSTSLAFPTLTENITLQLSTLLPNIESLQLNIKLEEASNLSLANQLLSCWSGKLVTFVFNGIDNEPNESHFDSSLGVTVRVSQMIEYTSEMLCIQEIFTMFRVLNHECLALQNFSFFALENLRLKGHIDLSLGNEALRLIQIGNDMDFGRYYDGMEYRQGYERYPTLIPKLTSYPDVHRTRSFPSKFTNLAHLSVDLKDFLEMAPELENCSNLMLLSLYIGIPSGINTIRHYAETHNPEQVNFPRLPSVKMLYLSGPSGTELQFSAEWAWLFPSIQLVNYELLQSDNTNLHDLTWIENVKHILQPLKQCSTLKWIIMRTSCMNENKLSCRIAKELDIEEL